MGWNFSSKTTNSIEKRKNDIIAMTNIRNEIQLVKFIKMPNPNTGKWIQKQFTEEPVINQAQSTYSVYSKDRFTSVRTNHATIEKRQPLESNMSLSVSEFWVNTGERVFDQKQFLEQEPKAKLISVTVYGYNYITAIQTKFVVPDKQDPYIFLHYGTAHEHPKKNEMRHETLDINNPGGVNTPEYIEVISCWWSPENHRIRSLTLWTNYENWIIMEGEVELRNMVEVSESLEEFSKIDNESILPESEVHRSSDGEIVEEDKSIQNNDIVNANINDDLNNKDNVKK